MVKKKTATKQDTILPPSEKVEETIMEEPVKEETIKEEPVKKKTVKEETVNTPVNTTAVKTNEHPVEQPNNKKIKYIIFGCGSLGYNILVELNEDDENVLLIDSDENRLQYLRDHRHQVMLGDMLSDELYQKIPEPEAVFVVSSDKETNLAAVVKLHTRFPQCNIVARSMDPFATEELADSGADVVLYPQTVFARSALNHMEVLRATRSAQKLHNLLNSWEGTLGIITHKNPDPDAISSAMALAAIAEDATAGKLKCRILYEGNVGHQENRAFVNLLEIKMERLTPEILAECGHLALVDCGGPGINNDLSADLPVNIIIDHHSQEGVKRQVTPEFIDIREEAGATASILTQYIQELYITVGTKVATALFYGIRSDTKDFQRNIHPQDMHNAAYLLPFTDKTLLDVVMTPSISKETLDIIGRAIQNSVIKQGYLGSNVGYIRNRDALPQAAEMLLNLEGVNTAFVYGITDTAIVCSGRNRDVRLHLGDVMKEAFASIPGASAGGHATMAALSIPLSTFTLAKDKEKLLDMVVDPIMKNLIRLLGLTKDEGENEPQKETRA